MWGDRLGDAGEDAIGLDQKPEGTGSLIGPLELHRIGWA